MMISGGSVGIGIFWANMGRGLKIPTAPMQTHTNTNK